MHINIYISLLAGRKKLKVIYHFHIFTVKMKKNTKHCRIQFGFFLEVKTWSTWRYNNTGTGMDMPEEDQENKKSVSSSL